MYTRISADFFFNSWGIGLQWRLQIKKHEKRYHVSPKNMCRGKPHHFKEIVQGEKDFHYIGRPIHEWGILFQGITFTDVLQRKKVPEEERDFIEHKIKSLPSVHNTCTNDKSMIEWWIDYSKRWFKYKADVEKKTEKHNLWIGIFIFFSVRLLTVLRGHSVFFIPATTANYLRLWRISIPDLIHYITFLFYFLTTGTIFITSLVLRGPWQGIEPGTSRTRSQG